MRMADWTQEDTEVPGDNTHLWRRAGMMMIRVRLFGATEVGHLRDDWTGYGANFLSREELKKVEAGKKR